MELGYTIPLQRFLGRKSPPYGTAEDLRLCWDLHILRPGGRDSLFGVHASSRYAFLLHHLAAKDWEDIPGLCAAQISLCMEREGFSPQNIRRYFHLAGEWWITKTHGRRPVAFLNKAVDDLYSLPVGLEPTREQPLVSRFLNNLPCHAAGHGGETGTARDFFTADLSALLL